VRSPVPVDTPRLATIRIVVQATPRGPDRCANIRRDADRWIDRSLSPAMRTPTVAAALAATIPRFHNDIEALVAIDAPPRPPANCRTPNSYADAARIAGVSGWASDALNEARILSSFRQSSSRPRSTVLGTAPGPIGDPLPRVRLGHQSRVSSVRQITISNPTKGATSRSTTHRAGGPAGGRTPPGRGDLPKPVHEKARSLCPTLPNSPPAQLTPPATASPCS
jgi:hypothetical protein